MKRTRKTQETILPILKKTKKDNSPNLLNWTPKDIVIKGCESFEWFRVGERNQYVLLVGEGHHYKGNSPEFIRKLVGSYNCPIDVIIESPFETYWNLKPSHKQSNTTMFRYAKQKLCFDPKRIPPQSQMGKGEFFNVCIEPFQGKLRIWAQDIRASSIFWLFMNNTYLFYHEFHKKHGQNSEMEFKKLCDNDSDLLYWFSIVKRCFKDFFDFPLYAKDPKKYHEKILKDLNLLYQNKPENLKNWFNTNLEKILESQDRSHLDFAEEMTRYFSEPFLEKLRRHLHREIDRNNILFIMMNLWFFDVSILLRIQKILTRQDNGIIVCFVGDHHVESVSKLLNMKDLSLLRLNKREKVKCTNKEIVWRCPLQYCNRNSKLMDIYLESLKSQVKSVGR